MPEISLEQRMQAVECAVRELQAAFQKREPDPNWLDRVIGSMRDEPAFEQVLAFGREFRAQI